MRQAANYLLVLLCLALLTSCAPRGAKNWPFSIGPQTYAVALGDLDGDGDLDAFLANGENEVPVPDTVWLNDGRGNFSDSGQQIGDRESRSVVLADIDLDGDLDSIVGDTTGLSIYYNDGQGTFARLAWSAPQEFGYVIALASDDLNGDGYPDMFAGGCCGGEEVLDDGRRVAHPPVDSLWLSDGQRGFVDAGQTFDVYGIGNGSLALGDLDGDGDLDAFFGNSSSLVDQNGNYVQDQPDAIWINNGQGRFSDSGQRLGQSEASSVALGDLDSDGDLDAFVSNNGQEDEVWLNAGGAQVGSPVTFILSGTVGGAELTRSVALADLDGDGDLDALLVYGHSGFGQLLYDDSARVWFNDGSAGFVEGQRLTFKPQHSLALGDLDGDGHVDVFAGSLNHGILVWLNDGSGEFNR
jgi:hypothetical protein